MNITDGTIPAVETEMDYDTMPEDGDYILSPTGPLGSQTGVSVVGGRYFGTFHDDDEALDAIRVRMDKESFWPTIWNQSDHGNLSVIGSR